MRVLHPGRSVGRSVGLSVGLSVGRFSYISKEVPVLRRRLNEKLAFPISLVNVYIPVYGLQQQLLYTLIYRRYDTDIFLLVGKAF